MLSLRRLGLLISLLAFLGTPLAPASDLNPPAQLQGIGIDQNLGAQVPLNLPFRDETGKTVTLSDYLGKKPAILVLAYYDCPRLCTFVLNSVGKALTEMSIKLGADYQVITVSINPKEGPKLATLKKASYVDHYVKGLGGGWHFLTGSQDSITKLADAVGYHYKYNPKTDQFDHATDIMVLTPEGKLSHYFMGITYSARDLRLALVQASHGKIGNPVDKFLLFCCSVDLTTGKYTASIWKLMQVFGISFTFTLAALLFVLWKYEPKKRLA